MCRVLAFAALFSSALAYADSAVLKSVLPVTRENISQVAFDFASAGVRPEVSRAYSPERIVVRFNNTRLGGKVIQPGDGKSIIRSLSASKLGAGVKVTLELKSPASYLSRLENGGARLVIDLRRTSLKPSAVLPSGNQAVSKHEQHFQAEPVERPKSAAMRQTSGGREWIVAIDAGHGGKDTGAIGPGGTLEKNVVHAIARRLEAFINAEPGMRPIMIRRGDQFVDLRQRADLARKAKADLFVSIHADAYVNNLTKGSSVFTLSRHGASNVAARWLADRANAADLVGGVKLRDKGKLLASVLLDLSQNATQESSDRAAQRILSELGKNHALHHQDVQRAGFVVLMSPDVPSLLVETAFISNPREEQNLCSPEHQDKLARSIFAGIRRYFRGHMPTVPKSASSVLVAAQP